jgi:hypothetical protein
VPANASPGDHAGGVLAVLTTFSKKPDGQNLRLDQRVATRVYVRVSGPLHPQLEIQHLKVTYHGQLDPIARGGVTISFTVRNAGNVKLGAKQSVGESGWLGSSSAHLKDLPLLFPGAQVTETVQIRHVLPAIRAKAAVSLVPERLASDVDPSLGTVHASASTWAVPWTFLLILAVLVIGVGGTRWWRTRRYAAWAAAIAAAQRPSTQGVFGPTPRPKRTARAGR